MAPLDVDAFSLRIGRVARAHGLSGEVAVQLFRPRRELAARPGLRRARAPEPALLEAEDGTSEVVRLTHARFVSPIRAVVGFEGVADRDAAERLEGRYLDVDPDRLPSLLTDALDPLVGATAVEDGSGRVLGTISEVRDNGAQPLLVLGEDDASEIMVPFVPPLIAGVDRGPDGVRVRLQPIPGLLDLEQAEAADPRA